MITALGLVVLLTVALLAMLFSWGLVQMQPDRNTLSYPAWFMDPEDTSWQLRLAANSDPGLGLSVSDPVRLCGPSEEHAYLASLNCAADPPVPVFEDPFAAVAAKRETVQPLGLGRCVDRFEVQCGAETRDLYLSPYRCKGKATTEVPAGFLPRFSTP